MCWSAFIHLAKRKRRICDTLIPHNTTESEVKRKKVAMPKGTARNASRRSFLTGAGGLAAAFVATRHADGAQPQARSTSQPRDRGLWATWYDLPDAGRSDYLGWVHGSYIPALLKRPGYLWAAHYASIDTGAAPRPLHPDARAVPAGNAYILVVGAEDINAFGNASPDEL